MNMSKEELKGIGMLGISASAPLPESVQKKYEKQSGGAIMEGYGLSEMSPATHMNTSLLLRLFGGRFVHPGYFYIVDRTKDMINVSGYKVYSREIDDLLYGFTPGWSTPPQSASKIPTGRAANGWWSISNPRRNTKENLIRMK
jgi:acyl-CoA synthetase (AMP-forming)/AMP-acid ligase II